MDDSDYLIEEENSRQPSAIWRLPENPALRWLTIVAQIIGVAAFYVILAEIGSWMTDLDETSGAFLLWPASGLALAVLMRGGYRFLISIFFGALLWSRFVGAFDLASASAFASTCTVGPLAGAIILRRMLKKRYALENIRDIFLFLFFGPFFSALISATVGSILLTIIQSLPWSSFRFLWGQWWFSSGMGILLLAPFFLVWSSQTKINWSNRQAIEVAAWLIALMFLSLVIFSSWVPTDTLGYPLELAIFPIMAWGAIRFGQRGATTGVIIMTIMAVWPLVQVVNETRDITQDPFLLWLFVGVATGTSYFLASIITELRRREERTALNEARLRAFIDALPDIAFVVSKRGRYLEVFAPKKGDIYKDADGMRGKNINQCWPQAIATRFQEAVDATLSNNTLYQFEYTLEAGGEQYWFEGRLAPMSGTTRQFDRVIWVAYEITERKRAEAALKHRDELLEGVAEANRRLLDSRELDAGINAAIQALGERAKVDRVNVYYNGHHPQTGAQASFLAYSWNQPEVEKFSQKDDDPVILWRDEDPTLYKKLADNKTLMGKPEDFSDGMSESLQKRGVKSILFAPVWIENYFWGEISFDDCTSDREWEESDISTLRIAAAGIGAFIINKQNEEDLRRAKERADAANRAKGEFLAMMSHEIRTPMNAVLGFTDLLAQTELNKSQTEQLEIISRSGKSLLELINNILDFSKIESRGIELETVPYNIETTVMEALELILVKAREKNLKLDFSVEGAKARNFIGDPTRLRQIILNLTNNAIKFTREGGITVKLNIEQQRENDRYKIYCDVTDTGIGIEPEKIPRLFKAFSQADSSTTRKYGGTGLGLVICKRLVEKMGGDIGVKSEVGVGSTFHFDINATEAPDAISPMRRVGREILNKDFAEKNPLSILVVEDDPVNQQLDREILKRLGYEVEIVGDGTTAINTLKKQAFDLVLMDIELPGKSGLEIIRLIRAGQLDGVSVNLFVAALTAYALPEDRQKFLQAGATDYLSKPIDTTDLKKVLTAAYKQKLAGQSQ
ncbi:ATP-binding protein [Rubellicoccus peritrichatus]|uniref:histidine kinase n=1 Tax=Rubellicoccus peritrichatus TaxID=3080537 RepID=A0AAQ3LBC0_9BACT|nr:ATP-binding protein [Puniceicoccus sp. CR14]WOO42162.1 ATP-binding protein [Puniceicoccus sp. CR14]